MPKVSIIVPVYKAEAYLPICIDSILNQTFSDFELLLIDDRGPDGSGEICDKYAKKDKRIKVIHKEKNEGASAARNTGLDHASGDYIMFCDSDDTVSPHWIRHLMQYAKKGLLPISTFCSDRNDLGTLSDKSIPTGEVLPISDYFSFNLRGLAGYITNGLYENRIIQSHKLRFRSQKAEGDYNEDLLFALQYTAYVEEILYTGYADYWYNTHEDSLSRSYQKFYFPKYAEKYRLWKVFLSENLLNEEFPTLASSYLYHFLTALGNSKKNFFRFRKVARSEELTDCLWLADCSKENPRIIKMLKKKAVFRLWLFYLLHSLKG